MAVSVIIPTLNEAERIAGTVRELREQGAEQIVVVDGGSQDRTREQAAAADRVLESSPGRAAQMNTGARCAVGDVILFLHADCRLEPGALREVITLLHRRHVAAGCFRMRVQADGWPYRLIDAVATARVQLSGIVYGDQGLFLRRQTFERLGGFPALRFLEDVYFSRRLRESGRIVVARKRIFVSPRRWLRAGIVRQTVLNWTLVGLAASGAHPNRLAALYPAVR